MRIRTIKPEFFTHEGLYELEKATKLPVRVAFAGLWCVADREGRFRWQPRRIGIAVLPYDSFEFSRVLDALTTRGFVVRYTVNGEEFGAIPSFHKHQVINNREKPSDIPEPSLADDSDATTTRAPRVPHAWPTPLCKVKGEGKGREGEGEGEWKGTDSSGDASGVSGFDEFWKAYPNKVGKGAAETSWQKHGCEKLLAKILVAVRDAKISRAWTKDGGAFIPNPATWLNQKRWEDELAPARSHTVPIRAEDLPGIVDVDQLVRDMEAEEAAR